MLPAESSFRAGARQPAASSTPSSAANPTSPPPPTEAMSNLGLNAQRGTSSPAPPAYTQSGAGAAPPPGPPPPPSKPILAHARALYRYHAADTRDLSFERDDKIQVHEYMNADWWMGRNTRTGAEGIFPKTYVAVEHTEPPAPPPQQRAQPGYGPPQGQPGYSQPGYGQTPVQQLWPPPGQPQQQQYAPPQQNPYNSSVPPMAVANQGSSTEGQQQQPQGEGQQQNGEEGKDGAGKAKEYGEKFGKKLGNAAIFGAGATLGGNLVNSIF